VPVVEGAKRESLLHWLKNPLPNKMRQLFPKQKRKHIHTQKTCQMRVIALMKKKMKKNFRHEEPAF
jgi:hypothetical protein